MLEDMTLGTELGGSESTGLMDDAVVVTGGGDVGSNDAVVETESEEGNAVGVWKDMPLGAELGGSDNTALADGTFRVEGLVVGASEVGVTVTVTSDGDVGSKVDTGAAEGNEVGSCVPLLRGTVGLAVGGVAVGLAVVGAMVDVRAAQ